MRSLRVRQKFWKPTTNAVQRFGVVASENRVVLSGPDAAKFVQGESVQEEWNVDDGYVIVMKTVAKKPRPIGVGLYTSGVLQSQIPKSRQRSLR
jgi:NOL1/NOP2/fmu family ribosome biogenesis protein